MNEYWDVYDRNRNPIGKTIKRGDPFGENEFYVSCEVWIVNSKNQMLVTQRHPDKKAGGQWSFLFVDFFLHGFLLHVILQFR